MRVIEGEMTIETEVRGRKREEQGETEKQRQRQRQRERQRFEGATLLAFKTEEGATSQGCRMKTTSGSWEGKRADSP